jgi:hypothetical protein
MVWAKYENRSVFNEWGCYSLPGRLQKMNTSVQLSTCEYKKEGRHEIYV